jgi:nucleolar protein 53
MSEIKKKRHMSRKSKGAWRKHIDIKDVDEFLEEKRLEERIGKPAEKSDKELFVIDTKKTPKPNKKTQVFTPKQLKRQGARRQPKAFEPLINRSSVQDPIVKR